MRALSRPWLWCMAARLRAAGICARLMAGRAGPTDLSSTAIASSRRSWPGCGRGGQVAPEDHGGDLVVRGLSGLIESLPPPIILMTHSMSGAFGLASNVMARASRDRRRRASASRQISRPSLESETADEIELQAGALRFQLKGRSVLNRVAIRRKEACRQQPAVSDVNERLVRDRSYV